MSNLETAKAAKKGIFEDLYYVDIFIDGPFATSPNTIQKTKDILTNIIQNCNQIIECLNYIEEGK